MLPITRSLNTRLVRRTPSLALLLTAALTLAILLGAAPAGAVVSGNFGLQRRAEPTVAPEPLQYHGGPVLHSSNSYAVYWDPQGIYREDWQQLINRYMFDVGAASGTLGNVFAVDAQYTDGSGRAANQSTFRGAYTDKDPYPTVENGGNCSDAATVVCLTDQQIRAELQNVVNSGALPGATGPAVYYLLTPPGVTVCTDEGGKGNCSDSTATPPDGICGYHSVINPEGPNTVVYAVQPWTAGNAGLTKAAKVTKDVTACQDNELLKEPNQNGLDKYTTYGSALADVVINGLSVQQRNVMINPLLNGWYQTASGNEEGDGCRWNFGPLPEPPPSEDTHTHAANFANQLINGHPYYLQWAFNGSEETIHRGLICWGGVALEPRFTAPNPVNVGDVVGFDSTESFFTFDANPTGLPLDEPYARPTYQWAFGDGTSAEGNASVFHSYQYGGKYIATLTLTDGGANVALATREVVVNGPPAPSAPGKETTPSGGGGGAATGGSATGGSSSGGSSPLGGSSPVRGAGVRPVATAGASTQKLRSVMRNGLVVRYSVNEQVAGRLEVLLARSIAKRLGIGGPAAVGLPPGSAPAIVIARSVIVTTQAGRSALRLQFSKSTASRLGKAHRVTLLLRLVVRGAHNAVPTTVLSTVTLGA